MDYVYILAQVFAIVACIFYTISMQCKKRKNILLFFIIGNVIGAFINYILEIKHKKNTPMLVVFYIALSALASILTFKSLIDFIPLVSAILHTITVIQVKEKRIRYTNLASLILWIPYYIVFLAWANLASTLCIIISNIISIFRYDLKK